MSDQENERLKRLRERQLADRDPLAKQQQFQQNTSIKEKRLRKPFVLSKAWKDLPHIIRTPFYGLLLGILVILALPYLWPSPYAILAGGGVTVLFLIFGVVMGNSLDLRDDIKNNMK